ncbi:Olfactory receptor 5V1 [Galemys pyrenaicus]|uniref:Olfactory receptor 5V1 n=1 Tax=Galemys pyrenaicus TaxID=202257 RepID=A0A8J6DRW9_GALPY|nr:Olfactory receptor 5V1 [Galemys pyrenaicus]
MTTCGEGTRVETLCLEMRSRNMSETIAAAGRGNMSETIAAAGRGAESLQEAPAHCPDLTSPRRTPSWTCTVSLASTRRSSPPRSTVRGALYPTLCDMPYLRPLEMNNQTHVTELIFLGFSNHPNLRGLFFFIFLVIYLTTLLGNTLIIMATRISPALHTPMYYFLSNLSFLDICYTSTTIPVMLLNFFREEKTISYEGCLSQIFFLVTCAGSECVLLAAMAYDRYVAICHPLRYPTLMSVKVCVFLVIGSWLCGLVNSVTHTALAATLTLCGPNQISHFLCDIPLILKLSCSDTSLNESVLHVASATIGLSPCLFTAVSYTLIISAILRIPSAQGRSKAFSTCASHLTVVVVFFGTANFNYDRPNVGDDLDMDILVSVLFCVVTPMFNPIIYSLRNKEVKAMTPLEMNNQTHVTELIFLGFSNHPNLRGLFFFIFLVIYLTTLLGNTLIIMATRISPALHTPMYYFLSNLSFLDICYTSTTIPVMLLNFFREEKTISYEGCLSQIFFLVTCAGSECVLLAAMAYDRYVAICHPLRYPTLMSVKVCVFLVIGSWLCGLVNSVTHTALAATLTLCGPNQISHFLCDIPLILKLSCSDTSLNESVLHVASATIGLSPCLFTAVSYTLIISAILRIPSAQGRSKAFSTCASHLTVVVVFYGTANINYDKPSKGYSLDMDILVSVLFCVVTPMFNPIIYSLRNKEVKGALRKLAGLGCMSPGNVSA